jgi:ABC-type phosphate/phosphonate transport system substrate-binding protein
MLFVTSDQSSIEESAKELANSLAQQTKLVVEARFTGSYAEARQALCEGKAHITTLDAFAYLAASQAGCGSLVYVAEIDGATSTHGQMITIAGKEVYSVVGFKGFRYCRSDPLSIPGWIVPALELRANKLNPLTDLYSVTDTKTDEGVIKALLEYRCDVGATAAGAEASIPGANRIRVVKELPPVPNTTIVISLKLGLEIQALLRDTLPDYEEDLAKLIGADAIVKVDETEYADIRQLVTDAKFDLISMGQ